MDNGMIEAIIGAYAEAKGLVITEEQAEDLVPSIPSDIKDDAESYDWDDSDVSDRLVEYFEEMTM